MEFLVIGVLMMTHVLLAGAAHAPAKRIVGGKVVARGEAKFSASLWYLKPNVFTELTGLNHVCGGTLIRPQWVLTSAHCFDDNVLKGLSVLGDWLVVLGENDQNETEAGEQFFSVEEIFVFPEYNLSVPTGDVALLKLNASANMDEFTGTIDIDKDPDCIVEGASCTAYGWGQAAEEPYGNGTRLQYKAEVNVWDNVDCVEAYVGTPYTVGEDEMCAAANGKDACYGDSGSPLVCTCYGEDVVSGIIFYGAGCANPQYPGVYERVQKFSGWIESTINKNTN